MTPTMVWIAEICQASLMRDPPLILLTCSYSMMGSEWQMTVYVREMCVLVIAVSEKIESFSDKLSREGTALSLVIISRT